MKFVRDYLSPFSPFFNLCQISLALDLGVFDILWKFSFAYHHTLCFSFLPTRILHLLFLSGGFKKNSQQKKHMNMNPSICIQDSLPGDIALKIASSLQVIFPPFSFSSSFLLWFLVYSGHFWTGLLKRFHFFFFFLGLS